MEKIMESIVERFNMKADIIEHIKTIKSQKEDWFLTELSYLLKNHDGISNLEIEYKIGKRGIDLVFKSNGVEYFVEIKHWLDRYRSNTEKTFSSYKLSSYLGKNGAFWKNDFLKLLEKKNSNSKFKCFFMVFYTRFEDTKDNVGISLHNFIQWLERSELFKGKKYIHRIYSGKGEDYFILTIEVV